MEKQLSIERLTEDNYSPWSNMMKLYLKSIGAWKFIEKSVAKPEQADELLFYRASAVISSAVGSELLYLVLTSDKDPESLAPC